ncbi:MAG: hypothetical protein HY016_02160 [Nitrosomonadales bacterium]|nr:hypothetical protein [Nitrosomonadales bacterium]
MDFTIELSGPQTADDAFSGVDSEEIMLFGRAVEIDDLDLIYHRQLSLPLFYFAHETVRYVQ